LERSSVKLPYQVRATTFVIRRMGGSCAQADKPEIQEPGRPEGLPRTAAIARNGGRKKTPAHRGCGALLRLHLAGLSGPVAELAATRETNVAAGVMQLRRHVWL
jgi:hypothetical protein